MSEDSAGWLGTPGSIQDSLTELLRQGARGLIEKAVEAELQGLLDQYENVTDLEDVRRWFATVTCPSEIS
jgi:hypothetical protein